MKIEIFYKTKWSGKWNKTTLNLKYKHWRKDDLDLLIWNHLVEVSRLGGFSYYYFKVIDE